MNATDGGDQELRQSRLCSFGLVLACMSLGYVALLTAISIWLGRLSFNRNSIPILVATVAFAALWLVMRGPARSARFVRTVELTAMFVGTSAFSATAIVMDLTSSPDMIVRTGLSFMLLVYAAYVPSTARHTLVVAAFMTLPLLGCIFVAFRSWDPTLHDAPAAGWRKGEVGDMAYPATIVSAFLWSIAVAIAMSFSQTIYGLRKAMRDIRRLGQYTLEEKLGEGGMGVVYRASHAMLRRPTAIKLLLPRLAGKDALMRFEREVRRTAMLSHPNTVTVFDYGRTTDGVFYYAMELLDGVSLDEIIQNDGPQPEERVIHILEQVAASLAEAHDAGLVHRDIKPANIMVVERAGIADLVKVLDFGLVKDVGFAARGEAVTQPAASVHDTITGTPLFLAPETVSSPDDVDARTDLYALGAVGYWLLTGTHVFGGHTIIEVCSHHLYSAPEPPSVRLRKSVAPDLEGILMACLAKRPEDRPASASALRERLRACSAAGSWTNARAARWWRDSRDGVYASRARRTGVSGNAQLTITRAVSAAL